MATKAGQRIDEYAFEGDRNAGGEPLRHHHGRGLSLKLAFTTAQRAIERLERIDIVQQTKDAKRSRVYCARALPEILEEPAHLKPEAAE
jgi:hypothetical protein